MTKMVYLVFSDQYAKVGAALVATYSDTALNAAFSDEAKARAFIETRAHKNSIGPLYWHMEELPLDPPTEHPKQDGTLEVRMYVALEEE